MKHWANQVFNHTGELKAALGYVPVASKMNSSSLAFSVGMCGLQESSMCLCSP